MSNSSFQWFSILLRFPRFLKFSIPVETPNGTSVIKGLKTALLATLATCFKDFAVAHEQL